MVIHVVFSIELWTWKNGDRTFKNSPTGETVWNMADVTVTRLNDRSVIGRFNAGSYKWIEGLFFEFKPIFSRFNSNDNTYSVWYEDGTGPGMGPINAQSLSNMIWQSEPNNAIGGWMDGNTDIAVEQDSNTDIVPRVYKIFTEQEVDVRQLPKSTF